MPYQNKRYSGIRTNDHETYFGYPSEYMHHSRTQKSQIFGGEYSDMDIRKELKSNEKAYRDLRKEIEKLSNI